MENYEIDWEDPSQQLLIDKNTKYLLNGCKCKKGCGTKKGGCKQEERLCGPGCTCINCTNIQSMENTGMGIKSSESSSENDSEEEIETEIITETGSFMDDFIII